MPVENVYRDECSARGLNSQYKWCCCVDDGFEAYGLRQAAAMLVSGSDVLFAPS